ncbi:hypothetical protein [Dysgonomonas sp. ZJ279]|uniref:hypothetical protein n=1 Tax=Dysgonomonas sp. ZJ279 TaxID=2709796 RepID=UPI0013EA8768|nr:hypothetical protein [Dysgonomonas sp. ZJ279]
MSTTSNGQWLNQFVAPQLLAEFKNFKDDFIGVLPGAPKQALTADGIRFNKLINNVNFFVDNTAEFTPQRMTGEKTFVAWEKYDTDPTAVDDAEIRYLLYDKRNVVRTKHADTMKMGLRDHVMWKLCPDDDKNANMPVVRTTGGVTNGRKRLLFKDLVEYLEIVKGLNLPDQNQLFMILNNQHRTDLILDRDSAQYFADKNIFFDATTGAVRNVMGFKFFENNQAPVFNSDTEKKAKNAVMVTGDQQGSLFFYAPNAIYHIEGMKILYKSETEDTRNADPTSEFRLQTYGLVNRVVDYGFGAIVSDNG